MGDDTPALQAVLDADVWRKHLLSEQTVGLPINQLKFSCRGADFRSLENYEAARRIGERTVVNG